MSGFVWYELVTRDQRTSGKFYRELFGWSTKEVDAGEFGTYTLFSEDGQDIAGMMDPTSETSGEQSFWHAYLAVESVDECAERAVSLGGSVLVPPHDVPDVGRVCAIVDPMGAVLHLMQSV